jgi:quinoprotein glucose dehydrogenase
MIFVLDRESGKPVFPVEERAVPQSGVPGEALSPTQPFPADLPLLAPRSSRPTTLGTDVLGSRQMPRADRRRAHEGLYTPPSEKGRSLPVHRRRHQLGRRRDRSRKRRRLREHERASSTW